MIVLMADQYTFAGPPHAMLFIMFFQTLEACDYRGIFFRLCFFGAKRVVRERVEADGLWLVCVEVFRQYWTIRWLRVS